MPSPTTVRLTSNTCWIGHCEGWTRGVPGSSAMSDFEIDQFLNDPATKALLNAERERITRAKSALPTARRDEPKRTRTGNAIHLKPHSGSPLPSNTLSEWDAGDDTGPIPPRGWLLGN